MSYYDDLGLPASATTDEIRARYRELAMVAHPDHGGDPTVFRLLNEAYEVLGDPVSRRAYDRRLESGSWPTPRPSSPPADGEADTPPVSDRWEADPTRGASRPVNVYQESFEGLLALSGPDVGRLIRWAVLSFVVGAAVGAGVGAFTGQATALAFGFGLPAAFVATMAFGRARHRRGP